MQLPYSVRVAVMGLSVGVFSMPAIAETPENGAADESGQGPRFFFGIRPWVATLNASSVDTQVVVPPVGPPVAKQHLVHVDSGFTVTPMTSFGVQYRNWVVSSTVFPSTAYDTDGRTDNKFKRREYDVSVGYAIAPNILASVVYKHGEIQNLFTSATSALTGKSGKAKIDGIILGLSANAPLQGKLSLYGNLAYGLAREKTDFQDAVGKSKYDATYWIGEVGFAYQLYQSPDQTGIKNLSLQLGYRSQTLLLKGVSLATAAIVPPFPVVGAEKQDISSTTHGPVLGLVGAF